jgi:pyrroline-5-carboxylate reductase
MKILIIGGGNMGLTYAQSFLRTQNASKEDLMILEKSTERASELTKKDIGMVYSDASSCISLADIVILAVKPQDAKLMFASVKDKVHHQQVFLSIMAGINIEKIKEGLGTTKVIRAMPNLPAQIGRGMTAFTSSEEVTRIELITVQNLLNTTGKTVYVASEKFIDAATAISGSGPAYVFLFMDAMISAARNMGFSPAEAELLVSQTFLGATELYNSGDLTCKEWIQKVSSKGGTTEAAMLSFEKQQVKNHIIAGANAALHRAVELGEDK